MTLYTRGVLDVDAVHPGSPRRRRCTSGETSTLTRPPPPGRRWPPAQLLPLVTAEKTLHKELSGLREQLLAALGDGAELTAEELEELAADAHNLYLEQRQAG